MAAALRRIGRQISRQTLAQNRNFQTQSSRYQRLPLVVTCGCIGGSLLLWYAVKKSRQSGVGAQVLAKESDIGEKRALMQTQRELRFLSFASVEYEGNIYMTPQDFLESVTEEVPRPRTGRSRIFRHDVERFLKNTPTRRKGSEDLFRNLFDKGIISYTEYLFLLCVLTKPRSGFRIAFNMFDTDGDQRVDKKEFLVLLDLFEKTFETGSVQETEVQFYDGPRPSQANIWQLMSSGQTPALEKIITQAQKGEMPHFLPDTTLLVHFFGRNGRDSLRYEDFRNFMENLQSEVLELEFNEFAKGMPTITEEEFALILLRYTTLSKGDHGDYLQRLRERIPHTKGIHFKDFKEFGMFLNNLDDFAVAMRMYTYADQPVSEGEFKRAVKVCTGTSLDDHLVHTVFQLFDIDGDGNLSHHEFLSVMKDRLHRGFKQHLPHYTRWDVFKNCVKTKKKKVPTATLR